jgi:hypothetical protein
LDFGRVVGAFGDVLHGIEGLACFCPNFWIDECFDFAGGKEAATGQVGIGQAGWLFEGVGQALPAVGAVKAFNSPTRQSGSPWNTLYAAQALVNPGHITKGVGIPTKEFVATDSQHEFGRHPNRMSGLPTHQNWPYRATDVSWPSQN